MDARPLFAMQPATEPTASVPVETMPTFGDLLTHFDAVSIEAVFLHVFVAAVLGGIVSAIYVWTRRKDSIPSLPSSLTLLCVLVAVVMTTIGTNGASAIGRGIGLFGILSILRFRTVLDDPRDITFVFYTLAVGMAVGVSNFVVAVTATVCVGILILAIHSLANRRRRPDGGRWTIDLSYRVPADGAAPDYAATLREHADQYDVVEQEVRKDGKTDVRLTVRLKPTSLPESLILNLLALDGMEDARFRVA